MIKDRVDQGMFIVSRSRVYDHSFRLVDNEDILVFIEDVQRDILRKDVRDLRIRQMDFDLFAAEVL